MALQLDLSSKFTVVFILCLPVALLTISYLNDGASHCLSFTELIIYIWQLLCHEGMKFKIRTQCFFLHQHYSSSYMQGLASSTLFIQLYARVGILLACENHLYMTASLIGELWVYKPATFCWSACSKSTYQ